MAKATDFAVVGITLLAPFLGGSTEPFSWALLASLMGLTILFGPPARSLSRCSNAAFAALFLLPLTAFLPSSTVTSVPGRDILRDTLMLDPSHRVSMQPWMSLEGIALMWLGLVWTYALLTREWTVPRPRLLALFCFGTTGLAVAVLVQHHLHRHPAFWSSLTDIGPFPNHNQTANVLALGGLMTFATGWRAATKKRHSKFLYLACLLGIAWALVLINSRAGVLLLVGGIVAWLALQAALIGRREYVAQALLALLLAFTGLHLFGPSTIHRFQKALSTQPADQQPDGSRLALQRDALHLALDAPWCGTGLGTFRPLFALHRDAANIDKRARHPESDWLWLWIELGGMAPLLVLFLVAQTLRTAWPLSRSPFSLLRSAAALGAALFLIHGLVDVSGHRLGALLPALFLLSQTPLPPSPVSPTKRLTLTGRLVGLTVLLAGVALALGLRSGTLLPLESTLPSRQATILGQLNQGHFQRALDDIDAALNRFPLDWRLHYFRGAALALGTDEISGALLEFERARHLEPRSSDLPFQEGRIWLQRDRLFLVEPAWREALRRNTRQPRLFREMVTEAKAHPELLIQLGGWVGDRPKDYVHWLTALPGPQFNAERERLLQRDPSLENWTSTEMYWLFILWNRHGNRDDLARQLEARPDWLPHGWRWLAEHRARNGELRGAVELVRKYASAPEIPSPQPTETAEALQRRFYLRPDDVVLGFRLYQAQRAENRRSEARRTLQRLVTLEDAPSYLHYLRMEEAVEGEDWEKAWAAWKAFEGEERD